MKTNSEEQDQYLSLPGVQKQILRGLTHLPTTLVCQLCLAVCLCRSTLLKTNSVFVCVYNRVDWPLKYCVLSRLSVCAVKAVAKMAH